MPIFQIDKNSLIQISEKKRDLEKDIQTLTETNLEVVFGLKFVSSEFSLNNFRIDTLAFDEETRSFVIIEYKKDRSFSVVDQGFAYLSLMLNSKADFILEYNEKVKNNLRREDIDWSQSRVVFIASSFTNYQQNAINFKDLPIELWEVKKYDNNTVLYNELKAANSQEFINTISKNKTIQKVSSEVKKYSIDDHFKKDWEQSKNLFNIIREKILDVDSRIQENSVQTYIGYKIGNLNIVAIHVYKNKLILHFTRTEPKDLNDPQKRVTYVKNSFKHYNQHISQIEINNEEDIDYSLFLLKQVYSKYYK